HRVDGEVDHEQQRDDPQQRARLAPAAQEGLDEHVDDEPGPDAVGDGEGERHQHDGQEGRDADIGVAPVDVADLAHQQEPDHDEGRGGRLLGDDLHQRGEEQRDQEQQAGDHAGQASAGALADPGGRLDVGGVGGGGGGPAGGGGDGGEQPHPGAPGGL